MRNEILLIANLIIVYGGVLLFYKLFKKTGLFCWTAFATIAANIEVMLMVDAFGLEQTLGNILFASTFVTTDILSENEGKKDAELAVRIGIAVSAAFIVVSQLWLWFVPSESDWAAPYFKALFSNTPRIMLAGFVVYMIVQRFDVWAYHKIWQFTERKTGSRRAMLWLRNNAATLASQLFNAVLFNLLAFGGSYDGKTLVSIICSTYLIYIFTSLLDTPVVYLARRMKPKFKE